MEQADLEAVLSGNGREGPYPHLSTAELERARDALAILYRPATIEHEDALSTEAAARRMIFQAGQHSVVRTMGYELEARKRNGVL